MKLALIGLATLCCSCSPAAQQTETKVGSTGLQLSAQYCKLDVDNQPATPGWEAWLCKLDEATAAALGVTTTQAVMPSGTLAKLQAADGG